MNKVIPVVIIAGMLWAWNRQRTAMAGLLPECELDMIAHTHPVIGTPAEPRLEPVVEPGLDIIKESVQAATGEVVLVPVEPDAALLSEYRELLATAIWDVEQGKPGAWAMIPGYGLQHANAAIPQLKGYISAIAPGEPYLLPPPVVPPKKGQIVDWDLDIKRERRRMYTEQWGWYLGELVEVGYNGLTVFWRNDSPSSVKGHINLNYIRYHSTPSILIAQGRQTWAGFGGTGVTATKNQDATLAPGQSIGVYFPYPENGSNDDLIWAALLVADGQTLDLKFYEVGRLESEYF